MNESPGARLFPLGLSWSTPPYAIWLNPLMVSFVRTEPVLFKSTVSVPKFVSEPLIVSVPMEEPGDNMAPARIVMALVNVPVPANVPLLIIVPPE